MAMSTSLSSAFLRSYEMSLNSVGLLVSWIAYLSAHGQIGGREDDRVSSSSGDLLPAHKRRESTHPWA